MILICSNNKIEGLNGTYASVGLISGADLGHATVVYTDNKRVIELAKNFDVEVRDFPKHPPTGKEATPPPPPPPAKEEVLTDVMNPNADIGGDIMTLIEVEEPKDKEVLTATSVPEPKPLTRGEKAAITRKKNAEAKKLAKAKKDK